MDKNKIPILADNWVVRGTKEIPRLFNKITNKIVKLDNEILDYILDCNGNLSFDDIKNKYNAENEDINEFYGQFLDENIIELIDIKKPKEIDIQLGEKEPWLKEVHIDITNNCNLRCKHCFWGTNLKNEENIPKEKWIDFITDLKKCGVAKVVISGGEAFTNIELYDIIKACYDNSIMIASIFTNGTINDNNVDKIIEFLAQKKLTTVFYISLDGHTQEQHDFIRGKGKFDLTINFIKKLINYKEKYDAKYQVMINSLLHQKNYKNLIEWYNFLEELKVYGWRFTTGRISGFFKLNADQIKINSKECFEEYKKLINYLIAKHKKNEKILYLNIENFFTTRSLMSGKMYIFDENLPICDYKSQACSVDPKGNVQFCTGWQSIKYGNVFEKRIDAIWYSKELQKIKNMKIGEITECKNCKYLKYCGGGCRLECKNLYSKDESICENFELFETEMIPILNKLGIEFTIE